MRRKNRRALVCEILESRRLLAAQPLFNVNAGGPQLSGSPSWTADTDASPSVYVNAATGNSKTTANQAAISLGHPSLPAGTPAGLFASERWDKPGSSEMQWDFPVTPGQYEVRLFFAETWSGAFAAGVRVFDVEIEGLNVLNDYDVFADVGANTAVMKSFLVSSDANLDIDFLRVAQNPAIKGIAILTPAAAEATLEPSVGSLDFGIVPPAGSVEQVVTLTHSGQAGTADITIDPSQASLLPSGTPYSFSFASTQPIVLSPGQSTPVTVSYAPTVTGTNTATLNITHSGTNSPTTISLTGTAEQTASISFGKSVLAGSTATRPTVIEFGPDGRLYVAQQNGLIHIYDVARNAANDYQVTAVEPLTLIQQMPNRNDDGVLNPLVDVRLITGMLVTGTAQNPVLYVTSSDPRIGAGPTGTDLDLDTNSGVISRVTWNGSNWDKVDLVRGLPRSEENHGPNGMTLDAASDTLYLSVGGNTNMGAPSNNFALLPEFALSAAILSVDLTAIDAMVTQTDSSGQKFKYNLPTLDDEDRPGVNDANDPFGGNNGKNQAIIDPTGPVQVYAPGFRNSYDVILHSSGRMYTVDNGPNAGWGNIPIGEGPEGNATNDVSEPGVTFGDGLHHITGPGYYGGHPNPTRSNPANTFNSGANAQSPVALVGPNPIESDYRVPGPENGSLVVFPASTNGIDEYTTDHFGGQLKGDLIIASFDNTIKRVKFDASGNAIVISENLFNSVGFRPLDVDAVDSGPWAGSIWAVDIALDAIFIFEPSEGGGGTPDDLDGDGYSNQDEIDNGTDPENAADVPPDWDTDLLSNLNDPDDDNDTLLDIADPFAIDPLNGQSTPIGTMYTWENDAPNPGGLLNLGFTGLMTNGVDDYEALYDAAAVTAGGAAGVLTVDSATVGTARGAVNTQQQGLQFGVNTFAATDPFVARTSVVGPFTGLTPQSGQEMGFYIGTGDQDNFIQLVLSGDDGGSIRVLSEIAGVDTLVATQPLTLPGPGFVELYLSIDPQTNLLQASYRLDTGARTNVGPQIAVPASWLASTLAVGLISTDPTGGGAMPVTWDYLGVVPDNLSSGVPQATVIVDAGGLIDGSSTFKSGSFKITNTSTGGLGISSISFDLSTSFMPDVVFDPDGAAGDVGVVKGFTPDSGGLETGLSTHQFLVPHGGGYDRLDIAFDDFGVGETFTFSVDIDPTSIQGVAQPGPEGTGSISGLELAGSTVTIVYSDSTSITRQLFGRPGSLTGSEVISASDVPAAPSLQLLGVATTPTVLTTAAQTARVSGPVGATVRLLQVEGALHLAGVPNGGFDIDPFEANKAIQVVHKTATIGATGFVDIPVTLLDSHPEGGINHLMAVVVGETGRTSDLSQKIVVEFNATTTTPTLSVSATNLNFGEVLIGNSATQTLTLTNTAAAGGANITVNPASASITPAGTPFSTTFASAQPIVLAPGQSTVVTVSYAPAAVGTHAATLNITHDGLNTPIAVSLAGQGIDEPAGQQPVYRINAGGPLVAGTPAWEPDTNAAPSIYSNAATGNSKSDSTTSAIAVSHPSIPADTPMAIFQSNRFDRNGGGEMSWDFPVTAGQYEVRLFFAEIWSGGQAAGVRLFDVAIENAMVLDDYDIFADVGGFAGVMKSFIVTADSNLDVDFFHVVQNPQFAAIEIIPIGAAAAFQTLTTVGSQPNYDVDGSGMVTTLDALIVINSMAVQGEGEMPASGGKFNTDVNRDRRTSALDALMIINYLSRQKVTEPASVVLYDAAIEALEEEDLLDEQTGESGLF